MTQQTRAQRAEEIRTELIALLDSTPPEYIDKMTRALELSLEYVRIVPAACETIKTRT